jgi:type VI secretion system secreted protein VgrG
MPPYKLPDNQTQSGIKTRSSKQGVADNFNEIRFEDKKGSEELYVHAEKDFNCVIENNETRKIGLDKKDKGDQTTEIQNNRTTTLNQGNDKLNVKMGDYSVDIDAGKATITAMTSIELKVGSNTIKLDQKGITVNGIMVKVDATAKLDANSPLTTVGASGVLTLQGTLTKIN